MKICQIIPDERDVWNKYERPMPYFGSAPAALLEGFKHFPDVEVHVVSCSRRDSFAPEKLADNIFYHQIPFHGGYRRTLFGEAIHRVRQKIREIDPDVVHGQGTEDYQGLCAAFSGYRNCITIHGNMRTVARKLKYRPFPEMMLTAVAESVALRKTDAVVCNSSYTEQSVGHLNGNKVRIPNAVRSSFFELRSKKMMIDGCQVDPCSVENYAGQVRNPSTTQQPSNLSTSPTPATNQLINQSTAKPENPVFLCIGDILPYKNQIALIHALDKMPDVENIKLLFAGGCRPDDVYGGVFLKEVSSRVWCEYVGRLELAELQKMLCCCAGVIHPTLEDSFGLAVAEAQASGVPVVASNVGGIPDLIRDGETGFLFDPESPEDICRAVSRLIMPGDAKKTVLPARDFARKEYAPESIARKHLMTYRQIRKINGFARA